VGYIDGAHSSLIDFSRAVAVGSLPVGTTALTATPYPLAVTVQVPAASTRLALSGAVDTNAAAPISTPQRACRLRRRRDVTTIVSLSPLP